MDFVVAMGDRTAIIRIVDVQGSKVRVGVTAPEDVIVHREEVWNRQLQFQSVPETFSRDCDRVLPLGEVHRPGDRPHD